MNRETPTPPAHASLVMAARGMTLQELDRALLATLKEASIYVSERQRRQMLRELAERRMRRDNLSS